MRYSLVVMLLFIAACNPPESMTESELTDFATRYAAAWSGSDPDDLASFYAAEGQLIVTGGEPSVARDAIAATAGSFMEAFPDMVVRMQSVEPADDGAVFHWRWTGTNAGPGGTGRSVDLSGYVEWRLSTDGLILISGGHYEQAEYERQMGAE